MTDMIRAELQETADRLRSRRVPFVLATVVRAERPTSAKAGDSALVLPDGTVEGFVGGSCAESTVRLHGLRLLASGASALLRITPDDAPARSDPADGLVVVGNPCLSGGTLEIFLEAMMPAALVQVFGDGLVARALVTVGTAAGYELRDIADPAAGVAPDADAVVVASHGRDEERVLTAALRSGVRYVALVASRRRGTAVLDTLRAAGIDDAARVHTPAGLDIGAHTASEVALSVLAEIVATRPRSPTFSPPDRPGVLPVDLRGEPPLVDPSDAASGEAVDPVCGMIVAIALTSLSLEHNGKTWYFCGKGCQRAFTDEPASYSG